MNKIIGVIVLIIIGAGVFFIGPYLIGSSFVPSNEASQQVYVIASWRNEVKPIGIFQPSELFAFTVKGEAAMKISVRYSDFRILESSETYFASGTVVPATISDSEINGRYDFDM